MLEVRTERKLNKENRRNTKTCQTEERQRQKGTKAGLEACTEIKITTKIFNARRQKRNTKKKNKSALPEDSGNKRKIQT